MLSDRTYLLFKPRNNLPNDRLNIKHENSNTPYGLSTSAATSTYRTNSLSHSSSFERLNSKPFSTTPLPKRKFATGLSSTINNSNYNSIYDNDYNYSSSDFNAPRRRTATFSYNNNHNLYNSNYSSPSSYNYDRRSAALQKSDSFGSTIGLLPERSSNMEKREMLMSSFNRHTNTGSSSSSNQWLNRLKLNNLFGSNKRILTSPPPSRPSNFYNYSKSNYSPYKLNSYSRTNYLNYDDYYRPKIRDRPLFSEIRKSVMHKSGHHFKNNRGYYPNTGNYSSSNYSNKFNKTANIGTKSNASILSNGSSGGLSSSSSGGSINYVQQSTPFDTATSPNETPASSSPLQSQKSIRKVDRYRSVIKFREHNIGKTYEERKDQINWDIDINNEDVLNNEDILNNLVTNGSILNGKMIDSATSLDTNLNDLNKEIWNVITDTTILTHSSSTTTLSDLNVGYEASTDEVNKLEQQFADIKRKNDELEKLKIAFENDSLLNTGKRKLHKSVNVARDGKKILMKDDLNKKSKSVKINTNVTVKDIKANDPVEQINKINEKVSKLNDNLDGNKLIIDKSTDKVDTHDKIDQTDVDKKQGEPKKILKTTKLSAKKSSKVLIKEETNESKDLNNNIVHQNLSDEKSNKQDEKFKNKQQTFKTLFVKPEVHVSHCNQASKKTDYFKPEVYSVTLASCLIKSPFYRLELEKVEKKTKLIKTDYKRLELESVSKKSQLIKTDFEKPKIFSISAFSALIKTDYFSPKLVIFKLVSPLIKTNYLKPTIQLVELKSDLIKTEYHKPVIKLCKASIKLVNSKTDYYQPESMVIKIKSPLFKTDYHRLKLEQVVLNMPFTKTNYESIEWFITKSIQSNLIKTEFESLKLLVTVLKSKLIKTDFIYFPTQTIIKNQNCSKTEYFSVPIQIVELKLGDFKTEYFSVPIQIVELKLGNFKTEYFSVPIQIVELKLGNFKTEYFSIPIQIVEAKLNSSRTEFFKVPIQEVNLKINCFVKLDYESPTQTINQPLKQPSSSLNQTSAKPPLNLSFKSQLNRVSNQSALNQIDDNSSLRDEPQALTKPTSLKTESAIKSTLSSIKSVLSLKNDSNELKKSETNDKPADETSKKKLKKVKKVKLVKKSSSISGTNNENKVPEIVQQQSSIEYNDADSRLDDSIRLNENYLQVNDKRRLLSRSISLDHEQNGSSTTTTFQTKQPKHNAPREQYRLPQRKRIMFREYNINDFYLQSVLGRGSFGKVFLAELIGHEVYFAIKCLKKNVVIEDNDVESTMIERKVLALGSSNPFICKLFCTFQTPSYLCFAMEYLAGGDLMFHVQKNGRFDEDRARFYAAEIVCALKFLHRRYIIYRDLKLDNILLDKEGHIRLVDFGMCQLKIYRQECLPSNFCGTPDYMAPEIVKGIKYNNSVDWWSFGVLLYEMLIGKSPFTGSDEDELLWNVCNEKIIFPLFLSKEAVHIIALLLNRNPDKRLGMSGCPAGDVTQQQFFTDTNWQLADAKLLPPPFIPDLRAPNDNSNFDREFTEAEPALTPVEENIIQDLNHDLFAGFDYTNPNLTD